MRLCGRDVRGRMSNSAEGGGARGQSQAMTPGGLRGPGEDSQHGPAPGRRRKRQLGARRRGSHPRGGRMGSRGAGGREDGGVGVWSRSREAAHRLARAPSARRSCLAAGEVVLAPKDVCLHSYGHGGSTTAASGADSSPWPGPKAAAAAAAAVPAASRSTAGLGGRGEAPNPRRGVPLLRGWTSVPGRGVPGFGRRPLPASQQSQE